MTWMGDGGLDGWVTFLVVLEEAYIKIADVPSSIQ